VIGGKDEVAIERPRQALGDRPARDGREVAFRHRRPVERVPGQGPTRQLGVDQGDE
jgi:hypothetical protein